MTDVDSNVAQVIKIYQDVKQQTGITDNTILLGLTRDVLLLAISREWLALAKKETNKN